MTLKHLENLAKAGELRNEPPDQVEIDGLLNAARTGLSDARVAGLSEQGKFMSAYSAAHALAVAALRWHGYRSQNRYLAFQCLQHTVGLAQEKWRVLDNCHKQRNIAEYEGHLSISTQLLRQLLEITSELVELVESLGPVQLKK